MIATDDAALRCDMLETYHILDYRELPARQAALFACGLGPGSRIQRKRSGMPAAPEIMLLATIADAVRLLVWQPTEDGLKGRNQPRSIVDTLVNGGREGQGFDSVEEFIAWRKSMLGGDDSA